MGGRTVRRWHGKVPRGWWHVYRLTLTLCEAWDEWTGQLSLEGVDPRGWDLNQLLAAFEAQIRRNAKDEGEARRTLAELAAEPREVRQQRLAEARATGTPVRGRMSADDADALVARLAAADAAFG